MVNAEMKTLTIGDTTYEVVDKQARNDIADLKKSSPGGSGTPGTDGENGATFTPSVSENGDLSWSNDKGLENPKTVNIMGPRGLDGKDGKSAYEFAQDGGYTGTEEEFSAKLAQMPLTGFTTDITPSQVQEAVASGRAVRIMYTDKTFGVFVFTAFDFNLTLDVVYSSAILQYDGMYAVVELIGDLNTNAWGFIMQRIATINDIPTKTSQLANDSGFLTSAPVTSVNGKTGAVTVNIPTALKNPNALTINGVSYDGSKAVNVTLDTIPAYVRTEAERVAKVVQGRKNANTITFIACSDLHHSYEISNASQQTETILHCGQAMEIIRKNVHVDFAAMLGDTVWDHGESVENALASMRYVNGCIHAGFLGIPNFRTRGNHDCLYHNETGLTDGQIYANIGSYNSGANYNSDDRIGGYCYKDFPDHKLRVICINTSESNTGACAISTAQNTWLKSALDLSNLGDGWRSIVIGHHPPDWVSSTSDLVKTLKAASGLIAVFHGHVHGFKVDKITGTEIPRIAIPNACFGRENEYGQNSGAENNEGTEFGETTTYTKTAGSAQDTAFCVVTIDLDSHVIYADHYGAGYSREIPYEDTEDLGGYKNLVPTAQAKDSTNPYNGTGYKDGYRLSSSSPFESAENGYVLTGYIPYNVEAMKIPGTIYIKGGEWESVSGCRLYFFTETKDTSCGPQINGNGTVVNSLLTTYYTVETLGDDYFRLVPIDTGTGKWIAQEKAASVTDTEFFRISLAGSGANLIITVDEPIE